MARKVVISDIHGMFLMLTKLLKKIDYDFMKDELIIIGDLVDRGPHSKEILNFLIKLREQGGNVITVKGNHDDMFLLSLQEMKLNHLHPWISNGGISTLESYYTDTLLGDGLYKALAYIKEEYPKHVQLLEEMKLYHEDDEYIYVHAGIDPNLTDWKSTPKDDMLWIRDEFIYRPIVSNLNGRKVIFGHTPVKLIHQENGIWYSPCNRKIGIDGGAAHCYQLNALVLEDGRIMKESVQYYDAYQRQPQL